MPRYFTRVADEMLPVICDGASLPDGLRLRRMVDGLGDGYTLVEFEDDNAPAWTQGRRVTLSITADYDDHGDVVSSRITNYEPDRVSA